MLPDDSYSFRIEAVNFKGKDVFFPADSQKAHEVLQASYYDRKEGVLSYDLFSPSRVHVTATENGETYSFVSYRRDETWKRDTWPSQYNFVFNSDGLVTQISGFHKEEWNHYNAAGQVLRNIDTVDNSDNGVRTRIETCYTYNPDGIDCTPKVAQPVKLVLLKGVSHVFEETAIQP